MLQVRRMMTEILLDVTTTEIEQICQEELKRNRASGTVVRYFRYSKKYILLIFTLKVLIGVIKFLRVGNIFEIGFI